MGARRHYVVPLSLAVEPVGSLPYPSCPWSSGGWRPSGFIRTVPPSRVARPVRPVWVHEISSRLNRLMVSRDGARVLCFTLQWSRLGRESAWHDWAERFSRPS